MDDKFTNGFLAGAAGGIVTVILGLILMIFKFKGLSFIDISAIIVYSHKPDSFVAYILAMCIQIIFSSFFGVFFVYLLPVLSRKYYLFKGWAYGIFVWFLIYGAMSMFQIKGLTQVPTLTVLLNIINASCYGLVMAITFQWLTKIKCPI